MPITLITGPANAGKALVVLELLREHRARGEAPLLVVPTRADVERYGRELAQGGRAGAGLTEGGPAPGGLTQGGLADVGRAEGARVERFEGLLAEVIRRAGVTERPLGELTRERLLATVAARVAAPRATPGGQGAPPRATPGGQGAPSRATPGGRGAPWRATRGLTRALAAFVGELEVARVSPARLHEALGAWAAADPAHAARARQLGALYEEYERALARLGRADAEQRAARALDELRRAPAKWGATPVLLYGFDDLTRLQLDAVETLGAVVGARVTVSLAFERGRTAFAGRAGTFQTLLPLAAERRELGPRAAYYAPGARAALHHLERFLFEPERPPGTPARIPAGDAVRLLEGGGERAELELVAEQVAELLERGVRPGEIAVAHRSPGTIGELLAEVFAAYGIPHTRERRVRFADTALGGALLGALATACEADRAELGSLLAWLRAPGVLAEAELADALEARARRIGARTAAQGWALWAAEQRPPEPLRRLQELREAARERGSAGGVLGSAGGERGSAGGVLGSIGGERGSADGARELIERTARELERLGEAWGALGPLEVAERRALEVGRAALTELAELAGAAPALAPDAGALLATLRGLELVVGEAPVTEAAGLERSRRDAGLEPSRRDAVVEPVRREAVAVLDPLALRARRVRALFLCGLQEGVFPAPARAQPLLAEEERRRLVESSGLLALAGSARTADALAAERYLLYAAVSRPEELLVLSWHTADDDGVASARSLFVDDVCDLFTCDLHGARGRRALGEVGEGLESQLGLTSGPREDSGLEAGEIGSAAARPGHRPGRTASGSSRDRLAPLRDERVLAELREQRMWSASALEAWAGCPARWFVERLLRAQDLDPEPEPLARGGLAHAALRDVLEGLRRETGSARLRPAVLARARELLRAALAEHEREHPLSVAPERVPGVRRRLEADLERYLEHAAAQASPLEPTHLELAFGFPEQARGLPALDLGGDVQVRGRIDRVDLDAGGTEAVVYDYKGAHAPEAGRWARERSFQVALYMRAVESLPGVRAAGGFYQPLSGRDLRARGALDREAGVELDCVRGDARERAELRALVEEAVGAARAAATEARAGALEARPGTCGFGGGCQYPTICRCEL